MPSPIAHSVTGYVIAQLFPQGHKANREGNRALFWPFYGVFIALAADLDFIPQLITGDRYHHTFTHSIAFTLGFSLVVWLIGYLLANQFPIRFLILTLILYGSHLLLDYFTQGGPGIQLLWPFTDEHFKSSMAIFPETHHSSPLFQHPGHILFITFELSYAALLLSVTWVWHYKRRKKTSNTASRKESAPKFVRKSVFTDDIERQRPKSIEEV